MKTEAMTQLMLHYVAFIDLLGFSDMVKDDCYGPTESISYLPKLLSIYESVTVSTGKKEKKLSLTQFSDSVVLAQPFSRSGFLDFAKSVLDFQHSLLLKGILCRGGLSYGKHFEQANFLFSEALIKAYKIESTIANYPRIVIDDDLIELLSPDVVIPAEIIIQEADNSIFLHYLSAGTEEINYEAVKHITGMWEKQPQKIREKLRWLREYFSFCYPEKSELRVDRFKLT